jgi:threonine/homoserine/homoserine lactone efflux protein
MYEAIASGLLFGLAAGLTPGPLFALVITQTMQHNTKAGLKVALVPILTDLPIIALAVLLLSRWDGAPLFLGILSASGGAYVLYLAYETFRSTAVNLKATDEAPRPLRKGILTNLLSPHPYLFWATVGAPAILKARQDSLAAPLVFIALFFLLLMGSKVVLAWMVGTSKQFLSGPVYRHVMQALSLLLALFALLLWRDSIHFLRS